MDTLYLLLSFILGILFLIGLIWPKKVIKWGGSPTRGKVFIFYFIPSMIFFYLFGSSYESDLEKALKDPEAVTELSLKNDKMSSLPEGFNKLVNLETLDLSGNNFTAIPVEILDFKKLTKLNLSNNGLESIDDKLQSLTALENLTLSNNPISEIPEWIADMPNMKELNIIATEVSKFSQEIYNKSNSGAIAINYKSTPLWKEENPDAEEGDDSSGDIKDQDHTESFSEFAFRSLLGNEYGHKRKFGKGEIYYDQPVTKEEADGVGNYMTDLGFFNNEREVSMLLDFDAEDSVHVLRMVTTLEDEGLDDETRESFQLVALMTSMNAFAGEPVHIHLCDDEFETLWVVKSGAEE
ncbi:MAG: leucine-rich repeat domain-containing protein [Cyclobacteriaceae bacterium]